MLYKTKAHSAKYTGDYVFSQLIPYIGSKRKLLPLIQQAIQHTELRPHESTFLDCFAGSGVVSRYAKQLGFQVISNDWEPYAAALAKCYVELNGAPVFSRGRTYAEVLAELNSLSPVEGWVTEHLCPCDDVRYDTDKDRMFYMRKNGMKLDAVRGRLAEWLVAGEINASQFYSIIGPLLYQACWLSNTSGVFKGFHRGWGGQTGTARYRICADFAMEPAIFCDKGAHCSAEMKDAKQLTKELKQSKTQVDFSYIDPPYNQHPYGSNYHVLNTLVLWDAPAVPAKIVGRGSKSAIRTDWRIDRRSAYNNRTRASVEYKETLSNVGSRWVCTSYSTDGFIPLADLIAANCALGDVKVFLQGYKRYRVSSQRFSEKPTNVEFVVLLDRSKQCSTSTEEHIKRILHAEAQVLSSHPEMEHPSSQLEIF